MTACYLQNRLPGKSTEKTPYQLWNGKPPNLRHIRIFESKIYMHIPKEKGRKLDACTKEGVLVEYRESQKGYRILHQDTNNVIISRNVIVDEILVCSKFHEVTEALQTGVMWEIPHQCHMKIRNKMKWK